MAKQQFTDAFDLFGKSIEIIRDNLTPYFVLLVLPALLASFGSYGSSSLSGLSLIGTILTIAFIPPLTKLYLATTSGKNLTLEQAFDGSYKYFWRLVGVSLLAGAIIILGFLLLIIPGFIMMRRYILSPFYLMDQDLSIGDALKKSADQTKPHSMQLYAVIAIIVALAILSAFWIPGIILGTILGLIYSVAVPYRYQEVKAASKK